MANNVPNSNGALAAAYVRHGFALCPIPHSRKGPTTKGWNLPENAITSPAAVGVLTGNVGLLHAYSGTVGLDVDDDMQASEWLLARGVNLDQLFSAPDRVEIVSGRAGRGKLLYHQPPSIGPLPTLQIKGDDGEMILEFRCADKGGNSVQDVLPPSIHPDTGRPYQWGGPGDWRKLPVIPDALLHVWQDELAMRPKSSVPAPPLPPPPGFAPQNFAPQPIFAPMKECLWNFEVVECALGHVSPDVAYDEWRDIVWAIMSTRWKCAPQIAHGWSKLAPHRYDPTAVDTLIQSFDPSRGITSGTLFHRAKQNGWIMPQQYPWAMSSPPPSPPSDTLLLTAPELRQLPPTPYVVRGLLPAQGLAAIYGEPGSGKSFLAISLGHAIATGSADWFGFPVKQTPVVYVALEGQGGIRKRIDALEMHSPVPCDDQFRFWTSAIQLLDEKGTDLLAAQIIGALGTGAVVIIDTLNQASPGADENSSQDMGRIIAAAKRLAVAVGGLVIFVHHAGKNHTLGLRGHSSLNAAMDAVIEVVNERGERKWRVTKAKDDDGAITRDFNLVPYAVGHDAFGPITSCAVQQTVHMPGSRKVPAKGKHQRPALAELQRLLSSPGQSIDFKAAIQHVAAALDPNTSRPNDRAREAVNALVGGGHLSLTDGSLSLI